MGALDEAMELRGMQYHPIDIETSIIRTHKSITEWWVHTEMHITSNTRIHTNTEAGVLMIYARSLVHKHNSLDLSIVCVCVLILIAFWTWFLIVCVSAVFTWTKLLVVVVELDGSEQEALDLVPMVTNVVLEEHYLIVGVVVVVDTGVIPINSRGEKQRMHLRDGFLADQLDPIYVAYNM